MSVSVEDYRSALRRHPAGVTVVTMDSPTGPVGFTATSMTSLSASPPLVCFNITNTSSSFEALKAAESVVVHILGRHQLEVARRFSQSAALRFADPGSWQSLPTGEPLLTDTPTWLRLAVQSRILAGDSLLVIGEVMRAECHQPDGAAPEPLIYHDGAFVAASSA